MKNKRIAYCLYSTDTKEIHTVYTEIEFSQSDKIVNTDSTERIATIKNIEGLHKLDLYFADNNLYNKFMDIIGM